MRRTELYLVQNADGTYRMATGVTEARRLAGEIARQSGRATAVREAEVSAGPTLFYVDPSGRPYRA